MADQPIVKEYIVGIQNNLQCSICLELLHKPVITKCGHQFCEFCILKCVKRKATIPCPLCKEPINKRGFKHRERLDTLTSAVRDLVNAYEEDSGYAFSAPSGPSRVKDITSTPDHGHAPASSVRSEKLLTVERVAMASLENMDPIVVSDNNSEVTESKKLTRKVTGRNSKKGRKRPGSKASSIANEESNSVFSAEQGSEVVVPEAAKEPPPDIFKEEDLCPTNRKVNGKTKRKEMRLKVQKWLLTVPMTFASEEESSPSSPKDDSQGSDQTVLLDSDNEMEFMDVSSQNATIAPDSSRSLSLSSATSPNQRKFFKHRNDQRIEAMKVAVVSPSTKTDDPYAFPSSGTKAKVKPKRATTRRAKSSTDLVSPKPVGVEVEVRRNLKLKKSPTVSSSETQLVKKSPLSVGSELLEKKLKNNDSVKENSTEVLNLDLDDDDDFQEDRRAKIVADCFGPDNDHEMKAKSTKTYARKKYRNRKRGGKTRIESESDNESSSTDELQPIKEGVGECSNFDVLEIEEEKIEEPKAKKLKRSDSNQKKCDKMQGELDSMETFELDVMTASQHVRETVSKREEISSRARKEVKKILEKESISEIEEDGKQNGKELEERTKPEDVSGDVTAEFERDDVTVDYESAVENTATSQSGTEELILEVKVKNPHSKLERFETVKRILISPPNEKSKKAIRKEAEKKEPPLLQRKEVEEKEEPPLLQDFSEQPDTLVAVSILAGDSEIPEDSEIQHEEISRTTERNFEESEKVIAETWDDGNVTFSASPVLERSIRRSKSPILIASGMSVESRRSKSPIIVNSGCSVRTTQGRKSRQKSQEESVVEKMEVDEPVECVVLKCRASDSSDDELPDLSSQLKTKVTPEAVIPKTKGKDSRENDVTSSGTNDKTDSLSLSVSQFGFEKPPGTSESHSSISSVHAPAEPLNSEHLTGSGKCSASKSNSSKSKTTPLSDFSKLSESETNMTMASSEIPSTQMQDNLRDELHDLSRLIREKEAQLMHMNTLRTQAESTIAPESDSDSDLFESQDATVYETADDRPNEIAKEGESSRVLSGVSPMVTNDDDENDENILGSGKEASQSIITAPVVTPVKSVVASQALTASPAPPTPPSFQRSDQNDEMVEDVSIIAPTPKKSPKSMAIDLARTFPSIKSSKLPDSDDETNIVEKTTQKKEWKRIQPSAVDSDSETEMVPNSIEDVTPKRKGTLDVFLAKKRLHNDIENSTKFMTDNVSSQFSQASESLMKTPKSRFFSNRSKGSELMKSLKRDKIVDSECNSPTSRGSPIVATGGYPVLPSRSKTRNPEPPSSPIGKKSVEADQIPHKMDKNSIQTIVDILNPEELSESCDFMAALRSPSPQAPTTPVVIPDTDEILPKIADSLEQNGRNITEITGENEKSDKSTQRNDSSVCRNVTQSERPMPSFSSLAVATTPGNFQSPMTVSSSGLSCLSPFQGDMIRARREQCRGLVVSGLDAECRQYVSDFLRKFDFTYSQNFNDETSHVIVQTINDDSLVCDRTLKYFLGIAGRCWVLSKQWLVDSLEQDFLEPEDSYEIKGDSVNGPEHNGPWRARNARSQLLTNFTICCHGEFSNLARSEIVRLIELCGGQAVIDEKEFMNVGSSKIRKLVLAEPHDDLRSSYFLALKKKFKMPVVSREWLLDSVAKYQVQKLKDYTLCTSA